MKQTFILIFVLIFLFSCENSEEDISNLIHIDNLPIEHLIDSEIIYTEKGHLKQKISSQIMKRFSDKEEIIELSGEVIFSFYQLNDLKKNSVLTCKKATINTTKNIMIANGDVNFTNGETTISSQELIWEKDKKDRVWEGGIKRYPFKQDLLHFNGEVSGSFGDKEFSCSSFRCTSDFADSKVLDKDTFPAPREFLGDVHSDSIGTVKQVVKN